MENIPKGIKGEGGDSVRREARQQRHSTFISSTRPLLLTSAWRPGRRLEGLIRLHRAKRLSAQQELRRCCSDGRVSAWEGGAPGSAAVALPRKGDLVFWTCLFLAPVGAGYPPFSSSLLLFPALVFPAIMRNSLFEA